MSLAGFKKAFHQIDKIRIRPYMLSKIGWAYFRTLVLRKDTLRICEFSITAECQSKCSFCYASKFDRPSEKILSVEEIKNTWEQAKRMGAFSSVVFGGEPLLHKDFFKIIEILEPWKHLITITTNAISLNEDKIKELKRLGVFLINLSLNSVDAQLNDDLRGYKGHYAKVMDAIELCKKHGIDVFLPVATSKKYFDETLKIIDFAKKVGAGVTINLMCAMGRAEKNYEELFDGEFWLNLRKLYNSNPNLRSDYDVNLNMKIGCPAGFEKIHIAPYGDVTGCSMNPVSFGSVREESLEKIVSKMRAFYHFSKRHPSCIVAVDSEYIQDYMDFAENFSSVPYRIEKNPFYEKHKGF